MGNWLYLKNAEIDRNEWDECIIGSPQGVIYAMSWHLDFCDREWDAVVEIEEEKYITVMPIQIKEKFKYKHIYQSPYSRELGVFSVKSNFCRQDFMNCIKRAFEKFRYIAKYRFNTDNTHFFLDAELQQKKLTHHLALDRPYGSIKSGYSKNRKRNLKKSQNVDQTVVSSGDYASLVEMFGKYTSSKVPGLNFQPEMDLQLFKLADKLGYSELYFVCDKSENKLTGGVFFKFKDRITYMFGSATDNGFKYNSMTMLMDYVVHKYSNSSYKVFDFEGSNDTGIARFYRSFGATPLIFNEMQIAKFPKFVNNINSLRRKLIKKYLHT